MRKLGHIIVARFRIARRNPAVKTYQVNCLIDTEPDDYLIGLSHGWASRFDKLISRKSKLRHPAFDLLRDLRAVSITASMPRQLATSLSSFYVGWVRGKEEAKTPRVIRATLNRIVTELRDQVPAEVLAKISGACLNLRLETDEIANTPLSFTAEYVWEHYMTERSFRYGVWGTQRLCFVAIFGAYENFLLKVIRLAAKNPTLRKRGEEKFIATLSDFFGAELAELCWGDEKVRAARLVRHSLSHCGGELTNELRQLNHGFPVLDEILQVRARDNKFLLRIVEERAWKLAEKAISLPQFLMRKT